MGGVKKDDGIATTLLSGGALGCLGLVLLTVVLVVLAAALVIHWIVMVIIIILLVIGFLWVVGRSVKTIDT